MPYDLFKVYEDAVDKGATFDARCFNVPENDICNAVIWRQKDAEKNSIASLGQAYFAHKELHGKRTMIFKTCLCFKRVLTGTMYQQDISVAALASRKIGNG